jgi:hypothetical protein
LIRRLDDSIDSSDSIDSIDPIDSIDSIRSIRRNRFADSSPPRPHAQQQLGGRRRREVEVEDAVDPERLELQQRARERRALELGARLRRHDAAERRLPRAQNNSARPTRSHHIPRATVTFVTLRG